MYVACLAFLIRRCIATFHCNSTQLHQAGRLADRDTEEEEEEEDRDGDDEEEEDVVDDDFCLAAVTRAWWQLMQILTGVV